MKINIICVGKLKEKYLKNAEAEYLKRLSGYANVRITEIKDLSQAKNVSDEMILEREGEKILSALDGSSFVTVLDIDGKQMTSPDFASFISNRCVMGTSSFTFIIGSSAGLSERIKNRADFRLSFSEMTFPHQLFRIMLLEQIYRAFKIINNETYHK